MARPLERTRSGSVGNGHSTLHDTPVTARVISEKEGQLGPCAANTKYFLFAQGTAVLVLGYDTLALQRKFERHAEEVEIITADNVSDEGMGRVVSVDSSKDAVVWESETGEELSRFTAYDDIRSAAWMRNGNLALGDCLGNVILFNPSRSESIAARTIFDPLCAIAPSADCRTFALGYENGSVLVAALSPSFTILHTLNSSNVTPSPITCLAWHASSSKQKSDMLATQNKNGDLRVWSVAKSIDNGEHARVVRVLKKGNAAQRGDNWMAWSKNGRIVQYTTGGPKSCELSIWDVRTKNQQKESIDVIEGGIYGAAIYGPKGILFTVGKDDTVQQYELYPPELTATAQHRPTIPPPTPPASVEEEKHPIIERLQIRDDEYARETMSPLRRIAHELEQLEIMESQGLGISNLPPPIQPSISSRSSNDSLSDHHVKHPSYSQNPQDYYQTQQPQQPQQQQPQQPQHPQQQQQQYQHQNSASTSTLGSQASSQASGRRPSQDRRPSDAGISRRPSEESRPGMDHRRPSEELIESPVQQQSMPPFERRPSIPYNQVASPVRRMHPLRQEIVPSPQTPAMTSPLKSPENDDFKIELFTKLRMNMVNVNYESPRLHTTGKMNEDDHRKEMIHCVFGIRGDIENIMAEELAGVNPKSLHAIIIRMWKEENDPNSLSALFGIEAMVSADWIILALSAMNGEKSSNLVARAFAMRLIQKGDLHMAVVLLLALGDKTGAVEIYVAQKRYLEAVLLTTVLWKRDWRKISALVKKWGEHAAETNEAALAGRCFACAAGTTEEPAEKTATDSKHSSRRPSHSRTKSDNDMNKFVRGLSISGPSNPRATLRMTPKNSPLKLITSFSGGDGSAPEETPSKEMTSPTEHIKSTVKRFFDWNDKSSKSAAATPIATSAISPVENFSFRRNDVMTPSSTKTIVPDKLSAVAESPADLTPKANKLMRKMSISMSKPMSKVEVPPEEPARQLQISSPIDNLNSFFNEPPLKTLGGNRTPSPPSRINSQTAPPPERPERPGDRRPSISRTASAMSHIPSHPSRVVTPISSTPMMMTRTNTPMIPPPPSLSRIGSPVERVGASISRLTTPAGIPLPPSRNGTPIATHAPGFPNRTGTPLMANAPPPPPPPPPIPPQHQLQYQQQQQRNGSQMMANAPPPRPPSRVASPPSRVASPPSRVASPPSRITSPVERTENRSPPMQGPPPSNPLTRSPLPGPSPEVFAQVDSYKNSAAAKKPAGLQLQWPPMESVLRGEFTTPPPVVNPPQHRRTLSSNAVPTQGRQQSTSRRPSDTGIDRFFGEEERQPRSGSIARRVRVESPGPKSNDDYGRGRSVGRQVAYARSPSSPAILSPGAMEEMRDRFDEDGLDRRRYERSRSRGRRGTSARRDQSPPRHTSRSRRRFADDEDEPPRRPRRRRSDDDLDDSHDDDFEDERFYTSRQPSRSRTRGRSSSRRAGERAPSRSPLPPLSAESHFMPRRDSTEEETDRSEEEFSPRRPRAREESRGRGRRQESVTRELRRSRSESTLTRWVDEGGRSRSRRPAYDEEEEERKPRFERRPSVPAYIHDAPKPSPSGLPATPRAWRGMSPNPGRTASPLPPMPRSASRLRELSRPREEVKMPMSAGAPIRREMREQPGVRIGLPVGPGVMRMVNNYYEDQDNVPAVPPMPESYSHQRNNSDPNLNMNGQPAKPVIRNPNGIIPVPKPVIPPGSPPPLPIDFPMHAAVNLNIHPSTPNALARKMSNAGHGNAMRRVKNSVDYGSPRTGGGTPPMGYEGAIPLAMEVDYSQREISPVRGRNGALHQRLIDERDPSPAPSMSSGVITVGMTGKFVEEELMSGRMTPRVVDARMAMI